MTTIVKKHGNHTFKLVISELVKELVVPDVSEFDDTELDGYVDVVDTESKLSHEEAIERQIDFIKNCIKYRDTFRSEDVVELLPKKKNGTFAKGRVNYPVKSSMCYISEDEYGYRVDVLRWKVVDDTTAQLEITSYVEKW